MNRCVVEYDGWQFDQVTNQPLIRETVESLECIINNSHECLSDTTYWDIRHILQKLLAPKEIGTQVMFPFENFLNQTIVPCENKIYVIKDIEYFYE